MNILVALLYLRLQARLRMVPMTIKNASITESVIMSDGGFDVEVPITLTQIILMTLGQPLLFPVSTQLTK